MTNKTLITATRAESKVASWISDTETDVILEQINSSMMSALGEVDTDNAIMITFSNDDESVLEVAMITAWDGDTNTATITREVNTNFPAQDWDTGSKCQIRGVGEVFHKLVQVYHQPDTWPANAAVFSNSGDLPGSDSVVFSYNGFTGADVTNAIVYGNNITATNGSTLIGKGVVANGDDGIATGNGAQVSTNGITVGNGSSGGADTTVVGSSKTTTIAGGLLTRGMPFVDNSQEDNTHGNISSEAIIGTVDIDLLDDTATAAITIPTELMLFVNSIDVICKSATSADTNAAISIDQGLLATTNVTAIAAGERDTNAPDTENGVSGTVTVSVDTAQTAGDAHTIRVFLRGYSVEM